ncbi:MAG: class I SAM-dependent methyltransferase [Solirubrobacterales bacterium]
MSLKSEREIEQALEGVEGWFSPAEAWVLHESIRGLSPERPIAVIEIGSFSGRSTIAAGYAVLARESGGTVHAIDPQGDARFVQLKANVEGAGVGSVVRLIRATSRDARMDFDAEQVDLIFVDGSHEYEDVRDDFADWLPLLRPGGIVAVNDPLWWGVAQALRERLAVGGPLRSPEFVNNTLFFSFLPDAAWTRRDDRDLRRLNAGFVVGRLGGSLLAAAGATTLLPTRLKAALLRGMTRALGRVLSWILPAARA